MSTKPNRKRLSRIIKNIRVRDRAIKAKQKPIRRFGSKDERRFARFGSMHKITKNKDLRSIKKVGNKFKVKLGGKVRGQVKTFKSKAAAQKAVTKHHDSFLKKRLGRRQAKRAMKTF